MPLTSDRPLHLSARERAAILAGLRLLQAYLAEEPRVPDGIDRILTNDGRLLPLSTEAIDRLCERLNA